MRRIVFLSVCLLAAAAAAQNNTDYGTKIKAHTTETFFLTDLVDHLPASKTVPAPDAFFGDIIGAPNILHTSEQLAGYLKLLGRKSPRVKVVDMGKSEEGREMLVAFVSDESNLKRLDRLREINGLLGDPRKIKDESQVDALIAEDVPMYWATGGMHAPESGPPEMLMELAYRLAVEDSPMIRNIRKNAVVMITPVLDVDGRDRAVDVYRYRKDNPDKTPIPLVYWGHYVAHDDNRDGMVNSLALSQNVAKVWMDYKPLVFHDLHESVPYLYISTGTGPYNPSYDPITIDEWHMLAYNEIDEMTKRGVPGVWTHDYYDGWAPSYGFMIANGHNGIGRFYETFGGRGADSGVLSAFGSSSRQWFRPNPPFPRVRWSMRNNVNISQSALLCGLDKVATEKDKFLRNFYLKSKRSIAKATAEGPAAYVLPSTERKTGNQGMLIQLLMSQGVEVSRLTSDIETKDGKFGKGSFVVRMDQPYSRMADMMLDKQYYNPSDPRSYDDTGWELGPLFDVSVVRAKDPKILSGQFALAKEADFKQGVATSDAIGSTVIGPVGDVSLAALAFKAGAYPYNFSIVEQTGKALRVEVSAGSLMGANMDAVGRYGIHTNAILTDTGDLKTRLVKLPRVALVHTWTSTQDEGWWRVAFDRLGIKYDYVAVQDIRDTADLKAKYDVIILAPARGSAQSIVNGMPMAGDPIPWKASDKYPSLGGPDSRDDIRGGIELKGMQHLQAFVDAGGLLICAGQSCAVPIDYGIVTGVSVAEPDQLAAPGGVFLTENVAKNHPVLNGYGDTLGVYFNQYSTVILQAGGGGGRRRGGATPSGRESGRGSLTDPDVVQGRPPYEVKRQPGDPEEDTTRPPQLPQPTVLLRFADEKRLLISGMLDHGDELAGKAAAIDCPVGKGHVLLFSLNPFWRMETVGSYNLVFNAMLNWDHLTPAKQEDKKKDG